MSRIPQYQDAEIKRMKRFDRIKPWWSTLCITHKYRIEGFALLRIAVETVEDDLHCPECARERYPKLHDREFTLEQSWSEYLGGWMEPLPIDINTRQVISYS